MISKAVRQSGLSLLELIVAFAILALSVVALYRSVSSSVGQVQSIDRQSQVTAIVERLSRMNDALPASGWFESGDTNGISWQLSSKPFSPDDFLPATDAPLIGPQPLPMHEVRLQLRWSDFGRSSAAEYLVWLPQRKPVSGELLP